MPRQGPKDWRPGQKNQTTKLSANVGRRVVLRYDVDRYPDFIAPSGGTGTVVYADMEEIRVRMDQHMAGAEQWDNEVHWSENNDTYNDFEKDTRFLT